MVGHLISVNFTGGGFTSAVCLKKPNKMMIRGQTSFCGISSSGVAVALGPGVALDLLREAATLGLPGACKWLLHQGFQKEASLDSN